MAPRHYMSLHRHSPAPNHPRRQTAALLMASVHAVRPAARLREVTVTDRRTRGDRAMVIREPVDVTFPGRRVVPVTDSPDVHTVGSLYGTFPPTGGEDRLPAGDPSHPEARRLAQRGRDRDRGHGPPVSGPPHPRPGDDVPGDGGVGQTGEPREGHRGLALHDSRRPRQAQAPLPVNAMMAIH